MKIDKKWIMNVCKGIAVFLLFYSSVFLQYIPIYLFNIDISNISGSMEVILSTFSNVILLLTLFILFRREIIKEWKIFKENLVNNIDTGFKFWFIGLIGMVVSNLIISTVFNGGQAGNEEAVQQMITALPWLMLIDAGILAPFIEEIVFRKTFKNVFSNKWLFIISSGLVFGAVHVIGNVTCWTDVLFIIPYSSLGLAFAASYYKTNTIFTPMAMHMLHNIILTLLSIVM